MSNSSTRREAFTALREDETIRADEKLKSMIDEYMLDNPDLTFKQAFSRVILSEPALHTEYLNSNGER